MSLCYRHCHPDNGYAYYYSYLTRSLGIVVSDCWRGAGDYVGGSVLAIQPDHTWPFDWLQHLRYADLLSSIGLINGFPQGRTERSGHLLWSCFVVTLSQLAPVNLQLRACSVVLYRSPSHLWSHLSHLLLLQSLDYLQSLSSLLTMSVVGLMFNTNFVLIDSQRCLQMAALPFGWYSSLLEHFLLDSSP